MDTLYDELGPETLRALVDRFYDVMDADPASRAFGTCTPPI